MWWQRAGTLARLKRCWRDRRPLYANLDFERWNVEQWYRPLHDKRDTWFWSRLTRALQLSFLMIAFGAFFILVFVLGLGPPYVGLIKAPLPYTPTFDTGGTADARTSVLSFVSEQSNASWAVFSYREDITVANSSTAANGSTVTTRFRYTHSASFSSACQYGIISHVTGFHASGDPISPYAADGDVDLYLTVPNCGALWLFRVCLFLLLVTVWLSCLTTISATAAIIQGKTTKAQLRIDVHTAATVEPGASPMHVPPIADMKAHYVEVQQRRLIELAMYQRWVVWSSVVCAVVWLAAIAAGAAFFGPTDIVQRRLGAGAGAFIALAVIWLVTWPPMCWSLRVMERRAKRGFLDVERVLVETPPHDKWPHPCDK